MSLIVLLWSCGWVVGMAMQALADESLTVNCAFITCTILSPMALLVWPLWLWLRSDFGNKIIWRERND